MLKSKWNLSELYSSLDDRKIEADFVEAGRLVKRLAKSRGKVGDLTSLQLLTLIQAWEKFQTRLYRLGLYASLLESTHVNVADITRFCKKIVERTVGLVTQIIFIETELARLEESTWQVHLNADILRPYRQFLIFHYEQARHTLSEAEEKILTEKSQTSNQALTHLFSITTNTLEFDWKGQKISLDSLLAQFSDPDPVTRQETAVVLHKGLAVNNKTTPAIYNSLIQDKAISDRLRGYSVPEQARLMSDAIEKPMVEAMLEAITAQFGLVSRYYEIKKRLLQRERLYWWDRYAPLPNTTTKVTRVAATKLVGEAYRSFSPELGEIVETMIKKQRIDWLPSPTKQGGAFCASSPKGIYPYVLLNYTDKPRDAMTLAHELGHAVHAVLADTPNVEFQSAASLALAEIASVFGEMLLFEKLMASDLRQADKTALLMAMIEDRFSTVFRQATMYQFEQAIHEKRRQDGELAREEIDSLWDETMKKPFGSALIFTPEHQNNWMYIPHIINMPFYVYSYAFAQLCVLAIYETYKERGSVFVPIYLDILRAGGSLSPKENLARAGFDLTDPRFWQKGLKVLEGFIDDLANDKQI